MKFYLFIFGFFVLILSILSLYTDLPTRTINSIAISGFAFSIFAVAYSLPSKESATQKGITKKNIPKTRKKKK